MDHEDFADEIRDLNLSYLILAQRMVQRDPASAAVKLGLEAETARWLAALPPAKLVRMASLQIGCRSSVSTRPCSSAWPEKRPATSSPPPCTPPSSRTAVRAENQTNGRTS